MRTPNTKCCICKSPLYRRPSDLQRSKNSYCKQHLEAHAKNRERGKTSYRKKQYNEYIRRWKEGIEEGRRGKTGVSAHIRRYLFERSGGKCERCKWSKVNCHTGKIPLEINHKDGNYTNNMEDNLELICPNCHSLTPSYKSLNIGKGRPRK